MSKQKTALNSRKGGGKKRANGVWSNSRSTSKTEIPTARRLDASLRAKIRKNAKASGPTPAEKRHAGIGRG
jgi:hypothetical protein